jgi:hypothetical protein
MNPHDRFIRQLESYLDDFEGVTALPEAVRNAVRAEVPNTKQARPIVGPARYLMMIMNKAGPVAIAAAAGLLIVAAGAFLLTGRNLGGPDGSTESAVPSASTQPTASPSGEACERSRADDTTVDGIEIIDVVWCVHGVGQPGAIAFTMEGPADWVDQVFPGDGTLWLRPVGGEAIAFALRADESVEDVVADLSDTPQYSVTDPTPVDFDGATGQAVDVRLAEGIEPGGAPPLIADDQQTWRLQRDATTRLWIVDVAGDTVMVAAAESLAGAVGASLATIDWADR